MDRIEILIALFPIVFMIHDFEEIIMFRPWLERNRTDLKNRFPKFHKFLIEKGIFSLSTSAFAVAVSVIFVLISAVSILSLWYHFHYLWFGIFVVYTLHLFVHIVQWIIYRKYVPVIITSILTLPYCIYTLLVFIDNIKISLIQMSVCLLIGLVLSLLIFPIAFHLAFKFQNWKTKLYLFNNNA